MPLKPGCAFLRHHFPSVWCMLVESTQPGKGQRGPGHSWPVRENLPSRPLCLQWAEASGLSCVLGLRQLGNLEVPSLGHLGRSWLWGFQSLSGILGWSSCQEGTHNKHLPQLQRPRLGLRLALGVRNGDFLRRPPGVCPRPDLRPSQPHSSVLALVGGPGTGGGWTESLRK